MRAVWPFWEHLKMKRLLSVSNRGLESYNTANPVTMPDDGCGSARWVCTPTENRRREWARKRPQGWAWLAQKKPGSESRYVQPPDTTSIIHSSNLVAKNHA